ncbi:MAG: acyl-CoA thioesterase II [Frankiaceae bacterium]|nr:acyl-CoA thioesterase II [Frankiaceae bacterium]MBV9872896.1 acyl-CoA thioesterase II [Frankiaceae bacterium]
MADEPSALLQILDLEQLEVNIFRGLSPDESVQRVFGGQVAGQALVAAGRTVPDERHVHSLHAYFLRPGDPTIPIIYEVDRIRDGKSFTTRRVVAVQHGKAIFHLSASFQVDEPGADRQAEMPDAPDPETVPSLEAKRAAAGMPASKRWEDGLRPIDVRYIVDPPWWPQPRNESKGPMQVWFRANGAMPDDPLLHVCAATYASDLTLLDSALLSNGMTASDMRDVQVASLDHAMWFHRPFRADDWLFYDQSSPSSSNARGLAIGRIFTRDGKHVVSVVQEGLLRVTKTSK